MPERFFNQNEKMFAGELTSVPLGFLVKLAVTGRVWDRETHMRYVIMYIGLCKENRILSESVLGKCIL